MKQSDISPGTLSSFLRHMERVFDGMPSLPNDTNLRTFNAYRLAKIELAKIRKQQERAKRNEPKRQHSADITLS